MTGTQTTAPPLSAEEFKSAFRHHPGGVALITAMGENGPVALTATSLASVSAEPPLLVFSVAVMSSSSPTLRIAETVVVHLLDAQTLHLAKLGSTSGIDRFADRSIWTTLETGEPVFPEARWLRTRVENRIDAGTATLIVGQPVQSNLMSAAGVRDDADGLVYVNRTWHRIGEHSRMC